MAFFIGKDREARRAYGFDEVAIVPGGVTINPDEVDIATKIGSLKLDLPFLASAMDGVVDVKFAIAMGKIGGLAVLNLDGVQTRYENPEEILQKIANASPEEATALVQDMYKEPIKEKLVAERVSQIKKGKVPAAVSCIPANAAKFGKLAQEAGADLFVVQSTVTTARHIATSYKALDFSMFCSDMKIPVVIGNVVTYNASLELMESGCAGLLVGVGPGAACTSRGVLGIGVPQVTATIDCAAARDFYFKKSGKYVAIITDGGMSTGGDICKAFASGADSVMVGSAFARTKEAPGKGFHWGMATPHHNLPRGTRIRVGVTGSLEEIMLGPARLDDGTQNLVGAVRTCMGTVGAKNLKELQLSELIIAPDIKHEGKIFQKAQKIGMGK
ncbi:MAG TPA: GuaB3 family IMP dehydrogenase-related protein [Elusimicrobia bacterium]|nr:MAG: inosine 5-monophosphate dehydrogenase [Elusimicrobia bacterium RIFOXYA12_FULL_49_49]OGS15503.1 MAG: inosine 5-monophosphate dehydrogenase [Elusimicrobia bacterium RIFOXYA2_FULL_47_53]OGS26998.1 MAG: inosine 5-monophosphate dehydrogenase [Elusimicrobia bacterium RIFOXYB12_FULL_50_12]OGS30943.1 MAG: inosine 5-monophosphate dehydrogenase [Elusimicrobia bacterium RIFOXYB2_FULL_46_23]HBU69089.1 GuaB3 family IMP dehydrogenase-related protein [Elusimicrobiota bacterium]